MVFEQLGDGAHLVVGDGGIAGGEGRLVVDDDLPELFAGIEVVDDPILERGRISGEDRRRSVEGIAAGKIVVKEVRIGVEIEEVRVAIVERVVALMVDLGRDPVARVHLGGIAESLNCGGRSVVLFQVGKRHSRSGGRIAIPGKLNVKTLRSILRKVEVGKVREGISPADVAAEEGSGIAREKIYRDSGAANVVVAVHVEVKLVTEDGGAGLVGVLIAVVNGKEEVAVAILGAEGVHVVTGIQNDVFTGSTVELAAGERGWKDTVRVDPMTVTRILVKFEGYAGRYVWHCHMLEHEDNEMMRPYEVVAS